VYYVSLCIMCCCVLLLCCAVLSICGALCGLDVAYHVAYYVAWYIIWHITWHMTWHATWHVLCCGMCLYPAGAVSCVLCPYYAHIICPCLPSYTFFLILHPILPIPLPHPHPTPLLVRYLTLITRTSPNSLAYLV
jgi:hypothetical protein